jgi:hypothetical protein
MDRYLLYMDPIQCGPQGSRHRQEKLSYQRSKFQPYAGYWAFFWALSFLWLVFQLPPLLMMKFC